MPNLLLLCEYASLNGGERSMLATLPRVHSAGFQVTAIAPPQGPLALVLRRQGVRILPFVTDYGDGARIHRNELRQHLADQIVIARPDLVHANSLSMGRLVGPLTARMAIPSVGHVRDIMNLSAGALADLNCLDRLLMVSKATQQWYRERGINHDKAYVLYNGVDVCDFQPRPATGYLHSELGLPADAELIGTIGQIGVRKGLDIVIAAMDTVFRRHARARLLIIGRRYSQKTEAVDYERQLHSRAKLGDLVDRVHFLGERDDVARVMNELTLLVHAARQEPLGRVLLEAAATGLPTIATSAGGTREIFIPGSAAALLVPIDDVASLSDGVIRLLSDAGLRAKLGSSARVVASDRFDVTTTSRSLLSHYGALLDSV